MKTIKLKNVVMNLIIMTGIFLTVTHLQANNLVIDAACEYEKEDGCLPNPDIVGINPHTGNGLRSNPPAGQGDFRVEDFYTGTIQNANYIWRGYVFSPSRDVTVLGMWGGSGSGCSAGFYGAIFEATITGTGTAPAYNTGNMLKNVEFTDFNNLEPEYVPFDDPITLEEGQFYLIAQGRESSGSGCHYSTTSIDYEQLQIESSIIDQWYPQQTNLAYYPGGSGTGTHLANSSNLSGTTDICVLVGFRYYDETPVPLQRWTVIILFLAILLFVVVRQTRKYHLILLNRLFNGV